MDGWKRILSFFRGKLSGFREDIADLYGIKFGAFFVGESTYQKWKHGSKTTSKYVQQLHQRERISSTRPL